MLYIAATSRQNLWIVNSVVTRSIQCSFIIYFFLILPIIGPRVAHTAPGMIDEKKLITRESLVNSRLSPRAWFPTRSPLNIQARGPLIIHNSSVKFFVPPPIFSHFWSVYSSSTIYSRLWINWDGKQFLFHNSNISLRIFHSVMLNCIRLTFSPVNNFLKFPIVQYLHLVTLRYCEDWRRPKSLGCVSCVGYVGPDATENSRLCQTWHNRRLRISRLCQDWHNQKLRNVGYVRTDATENSRLRQVWHKWKLRILGYVRPDITGSWD